MGRYPIREIREKVLRVIHPEVHLEVPTKPKHPKDHAQILPLIERKKTSVMVLVLELGGKAIHLKLHRLPEPEPETQRLQAETETPAHLNQNAETQSNTGWKNSSVLCLNLEHLKKRRYLFTLTFRNYYYSF